MCFFSKYKHTEISKSKSYTVEQDYQIKNESYVKDIMFLWRLFLGFDVLS